MFTWQVYRHSSAASSMGTMKETRKKARKPLKRKEVVENVPHRKKIISKRKENNKTNDKANKQIMKNNYHLENHLSLIHDHWVSVLWHEQCVARMGTTGILTRIPEEARQASHNIAHMPKIQGQSLVAATEISATIQYSMCGEKTYKCAPFSFRKLAWTTKMSVMHM